jgi:hypothetical protein
MSHAAQAGHSTSNDKINELQHTVDNLKLYVETNLTECKQLIKDMASAAPPSQVPRLPTSHVARSSAPSAHTWPKELAAPANNFKPLSLSHPHIASPCNPQPTLSIPTISFALVILRAPVENPACVDQDALEGPLQRRPQALQYQQEWGKIVELNVGGQFFTTALDTLTQQPDSMLAAMFSGRHAITVDHAGAAPPPLVIAQGGAAECQPGRN